MKVCFVNDEKQTRPGTKRGAGALFQSALETEIQQRGLDRRNPAHYQRAFDAVMARNPGLVEPDRKGTLANDATDPAMVESKKAAAEFSASVRELMESQHLTWNAAWNTHAGTYLGRQQLARMKQPALDSGQIFFTRNTTDNNTPPRSALRSVPTNPTPRYPHIASGPERGVGMLRSSGQQPFSPYTFKG